MEVDVTKFCCRVIYTDSLMGNDIKRLNPEQAVAQLPNALVKIGVRGVTLPPKAIITVVGETGTDVQDEQNVIQDVESNGHL